MDTLWQAISYSTVWFRSGFFIPKVAINRYWVRIRGRNIMWCHVRYVNNIKFSVADPRFFHPGTKFFHPGSQIRSENLSTGILTQKIIYKLLEVWSGLFIPDPDLDFLPIPDPGVKKLPDHWSGSATPIKWNLTPGPLVCVDESHIRRIAAEATQHQKLGIKLPGSAMSTAPKVRLHLIRILVSYWSWYKPRKVKSC